MRRRKIGTQLYGLIHAFDWFSSLFANVPFVGVDLASVSTRVYLQEKGVLLREKTYAVRNQKSSTFIAFGNEAYDMVGKTPPDLSVFAPIERGRVSDFDGLVYFLRHVLERVFAPYPQFSPNAFNMIISVPIGLTEVEEMALVEVGKKVGGRKVFIVETPLAAGFGLRLPIMENMGNCILDIGGGTTEISVVSLGGIVVSRVLKIGGVDFNEAIINYLRMRYGILIGERSAEEIKLSLGSVLENQDFSLDVSGRSIETGMPKTVKVKNHLLYEPLYPYFGQIQDAVREIIEETPPELITDITKKGIILCGMSAKFLDLAKYLSRDLGITVTLSDDPANSVIKGLGWLIEHPAIMEKVVIKFG